MIRVVTFDLDDTLWDVAPALQRAEQAQWDYLERAYPGRVHRDHREALVNVRTALLARQPSLRHHISQFRQQLIAELLASAGIPTEEAAASAAEAFARFLRERQQVDVFPDALPVLQQLVDRGYRLGALTNGNADVKRTPLAPLFSFAFRAEEVGDSKPAPALFRAAASEAGVTPDQMVHVGDHPEHDVQGAQRFGSKAIWLNPTGATDVSADACIQCLAELPAAIEGLQQH